MLVQLSASGRQYLRPSSRWRSCWRHRHGHHSLDLEPIARSSCYAIQLPLGQRNRGDECARRSVRASAWGPHGYPSLDWRRHVYIPRCSGKSPWAVYATHFYSPNARTYQCDRCPAVTPSAGTYLPCSEFHNRRQTRLEIEDEMPIDILSMPT